MSIKHATQILLGLIISTSSIAYSAAISRGLPAPELVAKFRNTYAQKPKGGNEQQIVAKEFVSDVMSYLESANGRIGSNEVNSYSEIGKKIQGGETITPEKVEAVLLGLTAEERVSLSRKIAIETMIVEKVRSLTAGMKPIYDFVDIPKYDMAVLSVLGTISPALYFAYRDLPVRNSINEIGISLYHLRSLIDRLDENSMFDIEFKLDFSKK